MRLAYTTTFDARDVHNWSGTPYHMSQALAQEGVQIEYIGDLKRHLPPFFKLKQFWQKKINHQRLSPRFNEYVAQQYSQQVATRLTSLSVDAVISPLINPIAYLECKQPIILWTDAVYSALLGFYPAFAHHSAETVRQGNAMTAACLARCKLAIFSSEWAANSAIELYGTSRDKVKVVPFGANISAFPDLATVRQHIRSRARDKIKLLFLAKSWERKGGDIALAVAHALHQAGHSVELNIVGYSPKLDQVPSYVNLQGFISKQTLEGKQRLNDLISSSHFLLLPTRADACPMVFAEANAFGLPCLTSHVGGIRTAVRDQVNGMTFALDSAVLRMAEYVVSSLSSVDSYETLAMSAYNEYVSRLNWQRSSKSVVELIQHYL